MVSDRSLQDVHAAWSAFVVVDRPKTPPGSMVTLRIRSWRRSMPSISGPRSTVPSTSTATPFVSGAACSLLIVLSPLYVQVYRRSGGPSDGPDAVTEATRGHPGFAPPSSNTCSASSVASPRPHVQSVSEPVGAHAGFEQGGPSVRAPTERADLDLTRWSAVYELFLAPEVQAAAHGDVPRPADDRARPARLWAGRPRARTRPSPRGRPGACVRSAGRRPGTRAAGPAGRRRPCPGPPWSGRRTVPARSPAPGCLPGVWRPPGEPDPTRPPHAAQLEMAG